MDEKASFTVVHLFDVRKKTRAMVSSYMEWEAVIRMMMESAHSQKLRDALEQFIGWCPCEWPANFGPADPLPESYQSIAEAAQVVLDECYHISEPASLVKGIFGSWIRKEDTDDGPKLTIKAGGLGT